MISNRFGDRNRRAAPVRRAPARRFGDPELGRFRFDEPDAALESLSALNAHQHRWSYSRAEYLEMIQVVRKAVVDAYGITPEIRDPDDLDEEDPDNEDDPNDDGGDEPDGDIGDNAAYSMPYITMLGKPRDGDLELRSRPWVPATSADRRPAR